MTLDEQRLREALRRSTQDWQPHTPRFDPPGRQSRRPVVLAAGAVVLVLVLAVNVSVSVLRRPDAQERRVATTGDDRVGEPTTAWSESPLPTEMGRPVTIIDTPFGGYAWTYRDNDGPCWWHFDPTSNAWAAAAEPPFAECPGKYHGSDLQGVWTGDRVILWGAAANDTFLEPVQAASYDPETDTWASIAAGPLAARQAHRTTWTGREVLVWGGDTSVDTPGDGPRRRVPLTDGAAYDPASNSWRRLEPSPLGFERVAAAAWTGDEWVLWGGPAGENEGAAYNPTTRRWRSISSAPIVGRGGAAHGVVDGKLIIWGGGIDDRPALGDGAIYDAAIDSWRPLPDAPIAGRVFHGYAAVNGRLAIWGGTANDSADPVYFDDGATYDPGTDRWELLPETPGAAKPGDAVAASVDDRLLVIGPDRVSRLLRSTWPDRTPAPASSASLPPSCDYQLRTTSLPAGWDPNPKPGAGGESGNPAGLFHWAAPSPGRHVTVLRPDHGLFDTRQLLSSPTQIRSVLDTSGTVSPIHEGYGAAFSNGECALAFAGYGVTEDELLSLVEGLYEVDDQARPKLSSRGALWPEIEPLDANRSADLVAGRQSWRVDPAETARRYGADVLRWPDAVADDFEPSEDGRNGVVLTLRRRDGSQDSVALWLARAAGRHWYSVYGTRHTLYTHCGVLSATVAGQLWIATPALADDSGNPPPGYDENNTPGTFRATAPRTAEFAVQGAEPAAFRAATAGEQDPGARCE